MLHGQAVAASYRAFYVKPKKNVSGRKSYTLRDLKIENLLLDEENNIKLIDFGLSNCASILGYSDPFSTQCGSPAYAAPELLARKKYGPKIDVWSIGVNMYAMLTGTLPFTVEPFSLRALYQKMVDKEMNPLPTQLSTVAKLNRFSSVLIGPKEQHWYQEELI
uniref:Uncharacterized protein n=1 Tax=Sphaerodactylus townsendi TaxID=933632 RepID=A0ACB8FHM5_9SAUR